MKKRTRSILEELNHLGVTKDTDRMIEQSASNLIESAINLLDRIQNTYDETTASELERRFINSIKGGDVRKFRRAMTRVIEGKTNNGSIDAD